MFIEDIEKVAMSESLHNWTRAIGIRAIHTAPLFGRSRRFIGAFSTHYATPQTSTGAREMNAHYAERFSYLFAGLPAPLP